MNTYLITVNGHHLANRNTVDAESRDQAITKWLIDKYGSAFSSSAPYNISVKIVTNS